MPLGWCIWVHPVGGADEGEIDSLSVFDLFLCVSDSVWNAQGMNAQEASYEASKPADKMHIM